MASSTGILHQVGKGCPQPIPFRIWRRNRSHRLAPWFQPWPELNEVEIIWWVEHDFLYFRKLNRNWQDPTWSQNTIFRYISGQGMKMKRRSETSWVHVISEVEFLCESARFRTGWGPVQLNTIQCVQDGLNYFRFPTQFWKPSQLFCSEVANDCWARRVGKNGRWTRH